jgi:hypothetical protein
MDVRHQHKSTHAAGGKKRSLTITPACKGPRRLAFRIRRRGFTFEGSPSLLISDRYGVWSVTHRRYIRKTRHRRFHDLSKELRPIRDKVRRDKMNQWPQYKQDEELRSLRRKLADLYWSLMPEEAKRTTVLFYRHRRQRQRQRQGRLMCFTAAVVVVALEGFVLLSLVLMGCFSLWVRLFLGLGYLALVFLLDRAAEEYDR